MRLSADQVKAGVLHADQDVREACVHYFAKSLSSDPTVMPLVIQAIERYGFLSAFQSYLFMSNLAQTDSTVRWLIDKLTQLSHPAGMEEIDPILMYISVLSHADPALLKQHEPEILDLIILDPDSKDILAESIGFRSRPAEELWQEFEEFCENQDVDPFLGDEEFERGARLVAALACHQDRYAKEVLRIIGGETDERGTCKELFAIRLAAEMKLEEAVPLMLAMLHEGPDELVAEEIHRAFTKFGSDAVVARLVGRYADSDSIERMAIAGTLENIHSDAAVQGCLDLLNREGDPELTALLLQALLLNFASEGIEPARQFILHTPAPRDPEVLQVRSCLLTACKLIGETFPEFDAWLEDSKNDEEVLRQWDEEHGIPEDEILDDDEDDDEDFWGEPPHPPATFVRPTERIGRNDPCPCGSGKKYKKCCYGKNADEAEGDVFAGGGMSGLGRPRTAPKYPIGTVAFYGPDDKRTTKIAAGVILHDGAEAIIERWVASDVTTNPKVQREMKAFFKKYGVKSVAASDGNMGCPHEEGEDFPYGGDCPLCPFWKGKQGSNSGG